MKRQLSRLLILFGVVFWLFALGFMLAKSTKEKSSENVAPLVGYTAPDFELKNLSDQSIKLGDFLGRPVLINFWATWCSYCLQEMPVIEKYYERYTPNLVVLAVEVGDSVEEVRSVVAKNGFKFFIVRDPDSLVFEKYRLDSFPSTFVLDAKGIIQVKHLGYMNENKLVEYLNKVGFSK